MADYLPGVTYQHLETGEYEIDCGLNLAARPVIKGGTIREIPHLVVLSVPEIVPDIKVESIGEIRIEA